MAPGPPGARLSVEERRFWIGLACVAVLHAALLIGIGTANPRIMGEPEGKLDGISVELVDQADFESQTTVKLPQSPPQPQQDPARDPGAPPQPARTPTPPPVEAPRPTARPAEPQPPAVPPVEEQTPSLDALPDLPGKQTPAPPPKSKPAPQRAPDRPLDLTMPAMPSLSPGGRSAAVSRPPGVTRTGENDEFGRGVIRALRQTMPPPRDVRGRVTVRLLLSEHGNLVEVVVARSAGDPILDQNVVFAVKQSSFPIPPRGSSLIDRTFLVTYIYH